MTFEESNGLVHFHIIDQGIGIPKKMFAGLFEVSIATKRTGTKGETGNGFGLPIENNAEVVSESGPDIVITLRGRKAE